MVSAYYAPPKVTSNKYKLFYTEFPPLVFWIAAGILHFQRSPWIILVLHHSYFWQISVRPWLVVLNIVLLLYFWLHHIFGWMKCHHWLSVSYKLISAIDGDAITNMEWYPSLTARQTVNVFVLTHIALPSPDDTRKENHVQSYAPWGALSLNQRDSLTSKLDGYPAGWDSPLSGAKPVHEENCQGIKLRIAHKIKRLNSRLQVKRKSKT